MPIPRRFPIGFWNYTRLDQHAINHAAVACVKDWAEAGMTLAMGPNYRSVPRDVKRMLAILDAAAEADIRVILCHDDGYLPHLTAKGEAVYRRDFVRAVKALGRHPAASGFHVGDEPDAAQFADACKALRIQKELAPQLQPFLNLFPKHPGGEVRVGCDRWEQYLDRYVAAARPPLLCYDCYAQMNPKADSNTAGYEGWQMYFDNLWIHRQAALRHGLDYWTTLLSVAHFNFLCPSEDGLRWQLNTALASGARGILWFFLYQREPHNNYRLAPIDEHWERTETYAWLSRVCRTFLKWHAPVLLESRLVKAWHVGKAWAPWPRFDGVGPVVKAGSSAGTPLIVSQFKHAGGADYLAIVNNSQTANTQFELVVKGKRPRLHRVGWQGAETPVVDVTVREAGRDANLFTASWHLAPGQLELLRVENVSGW